jgi:HAE1 family hydrophobic/amphiphilic exporter-1
VGFSLLSSVNNPNSGFFFVTLKPWESSDPQGLTARCVPAAGSIIAWRRCAGVGICLCAAGDSRVGTSGGITMMLQDRAGKEVPFLAQTRKSFSLPFATAGVRASGHDLYSQCPQLKNN